MTRPPERIHDLAAETLRELLSENLSQFHRRPLNLDTAAHAAVSITVMPYRSEPHIVLIKRARRGRNSGHWALPGGRVESGESVQDAGLRELAEETGIRATPRDVVGVLDDYRTTSGFVITPHVIALTQTHALHRDPKEVHSIHPIPLRRLLTPDLPRWRPQPGQPPLLQMPLRHDIVIHAPTGALLLQFRDVALLGHPTRVADLAQPEWTRQ